RDGVTGTTAPATPPPSAGATDNSGSLTPAPPKKYTTFTATSPNDVAGLGLPGSLNLGDPTPQPPQVDPTPTANSPNDVVKPGLAGSPNPGDPAPQPQQDEPTPTANSPTHA